MQERSIFYCTYAHSIVSDVYITVYCCILLVLMFMKMFSAHVVSTAHLSILGRVIPHLWLCFRVLHCPKKDFKFFLTRFEGLRTEGVTTYSMVHVTFVHSYLNGVVHVIRRKCGGPAERTSFTLSARSSAQYCVTHGKSLHISATVNLFNKLYTK